MKNMKKKRIFSIAVLLVLALSSILLAEPSNRIVAVVNENVITLYELNAKVEEVTGLRVEDMKAGDEKAFLETQKSVLDMLIDEKITREKIQELGIKVSPDQIDATIEDIIRNNRLTRETLTANLKNEGISYERYRDIIRNEIERNRLISYEVTSKIIIREEKVYQYYQEHIEDYTEDAEISLAGIFLNEKEPGILSEKIDLILSGIEKGEEFGDLAARYSEGPGSDRGGNLGEFRISDLDPGLRKVLENMAEGDVSFPDKNGSGPHIIKLLKRTDARVVPFEEAKDGIYDILYTEEINKRYASWIENLRKSTYTRINL